MADDGGRGKGKRKSGRTFGFTDQPSGLGRGSSARKLSPEQHRGLTLLPLQGCECGYALLQRLFSGVGGVIIWIVSTDRAPVLETRDSTLLLGDYTHAPTSLPVILFY